MVKCTSHSTTNWVLMDSVRDAGRNDGWYTRFEVNDSVAETDDYSSNKRYQVSDTGFQLTTASNSWNGSGRTYMFLTFAE